MSKKEIEARLRKQAKQFRNLGYTFSGLVDHYLMEQRYKEELLRRLRFIDKCVDEFGSKPICTCSAMVYDSNKEGFVVPFMYCVIKEGEKAIGCCYVNSTKEENKKALKLHEEYVKEGKENW